MTGRAAAEQARPLDRSSPMPLWAQLQEELDRRLALHHFDASFPGEMELVRTYQVSRHTVREALRRLREAGVLDSSRGRGTHVRRSFEQPLGSLYSLFRAVEASGVEQTSVVRGQAMVTDADAAGVLGEPPEAELFRLERVRLAAGAPLALDVVWLSGSLGRPLLDADFGHRALYDELAARLDVRLTGGRERITAVVPSAAERALLDLPRGVACLRVERTGLLRSRPVEFRQTLVRGDRYAVVADWTERGYSVGAQASGAAGPVTAPARTDRAGGEPDDDDPGYDVG